MSSSATTERQIEAGRLRRAWAAVTQGRVTDLGEGQYKVIGSGLSRYYVDLTAETPCYCADAENRGKRTTCYHTLAALLRAHDEQVCVAAGLMIQKRAPKSSVLT